MKHRRRSKKIRLTLASLIRAGEPAAAFAIWSELQAIRSAKP